MKSLSALQVRKGFEKSDGDLPILLLHHSIIIFVFVLSQYTNYIGVAAVVLSVVVVAKRSIDFNSQVVAKPNNLKYSYIAACTAVRFCCSLCPVLSMLF